MASILGWLIEPEVGPGVVTDDLAPLVVPDLPELLFDDLPRVGPVALHMGEIGRPLDPVPPDVMTDLHPEVIHLKPPVVVVVDVPAGLMGPGVSAAPVLVTAPVLVGILFELRNPADLGLGKKELQVGKTVE